MKRREGEKKGRKEGEKEEKGTGMEGGGGRRERTEETGEFGSRRSRRKRRFLNGALRDYQALKTLHLYYLTSGQPSKVNIALCIFFNEGNMVRDEIYTRLNGKQDSQILVWLICLQDTCPLSHSTLCRDCLSVPDLIHLMVLITSPSRSCGNVIHTDLFLFLKILEKTFFKKREKVHKPLLSGETDI